MAKVKDIRDFIVDEEELVDEGKAPVLKNLAPPKIKVSYRALIQSGCDFVVERKEKGKPDECLVVLVSQESFYLESGTQKKRLSKKSLWSFLKSIPRAGLKLPEVNWLPALYPQMAFADELFQVFQDRELVGFLSKGMISIPEEYFKRMQIDEDGYYPIREFYLWKPAVCDSQPIMDNKVSPFFELDTYGMATLRQVPLQVADPFANQIPQPFEDGITCNNLFSFRSPGALGRINQTRAALAERPDLIRGFAENDDEDPFDDREEIDDEEPVFFCKEQLWMMSEWRTILYAGMLLSIESPGLYRDMLRLLQERDQCDLKTLFREHLMKKDTPENRLLQCFHSFILIRNYFGPEWGVRAMEAYLNNGMETLLPYDFIQKLLYKETELMDYMNEVHYRNLTPAWTFKAESFMSYLFEGSAREGFADDLAGYIARWDNALHFQKLLYGKVVEKYPENLASYEHKLAYKVRAERDTLYQKLWDDKAKECAVLEYERGDYKIIAARSKADLVEESNRQHNCVNTYEGNVLSGKCNIFFMRYTDPEKSDTSILTIELKRGGTLGQVKGKYNHAPRMQELIFVQEWAREKGLRFDENETMAVGW